MLRKLPYLSEETNRHGNPRLYVRVMGRRIQLKEEPDTPTFMREYAEAVDKLKRGAGTPKKELTRKPGTLAWIGVLYFQSPKYKSLNEIAKKTRRGALESCFKEPRTPNSPDLLGDCPLSMLSTKHIRMLRDRKAEFRGAANNRLKYLSAMFSWAIEEELMETNLVRDVKKLKYSTDGFHTWTIDEIQQFEKRWPIGTKPRLAMALLRYTGARRGDMVTFGRQHVRNGALSYIPSKTKYVRMTASEKPILPALQKVLDGSPCGDLTFLVTKYGKPFTPAGFGNWFREQCDKAGLPQCSAHGLKKAAATIAAEEGATDRQLMAIFDWSTASQANVYTKKARQRRLAQAAMALIANDQTPAQTEGEIVGPESESAVAPLAKTGT